MNVIEAPPQTEVDVADKFMDACKLVFTLARTAVLETEIQPLAVAFT